jgi:hypothetical protein
MSAALLSCSNVGPGDGLATVSLQLQIAPGVTVNTVSWMVSNAVSGFTRSGSTNVQFSNTVRFQVGGIPAGTGYTLALNATSTNGAFTCAGSAVFDVTAGHTTNVTVNLACSAAGAGAGTVVVTGTTQICANIDAISVSPLETTVNNPIALSATASAGPVTPTFAWTSSAGTFDNPAGASPIFTCPATPGDVVITLTVSPGGAACLTATSQSVTVTCDTLNPTFTNVYANVIAARCTSCHRPGGGGFTVGLLDLSTQAAAYSNLVGVAAQGTGAGTSGITCASASLTRVTPNDAAHSLLVNKISSKLAGTVPACGSPMPPGAAAPLTAAQADLIVSWIGAGALND